MRSLDQFDPGQTIGPGCRRVRDRVTGDPGLLHEIGPGSPSIEFLTRHGILLASGVRAGISYAITQDRPGLVDFAAWAVRVRETEPGEVSMVFRLPGAESLAPGEFTSLFQPKRPPHGEESESTPKETGSSK